MLIRRTLSLIGGVCCALPLWPAGSAHPIYGVALALIAGAAFADATIGLMLVMALSPIATMAVSTFWSTPGDWAETIVLAAGAGWLLRQALAAHGTSRIGPAAGGWPAAILACVGAASLIVQLAVLAMKISPELLVGDLVASARDYPSAHTLSTLALRPVALLLEGLLVFAVAATPRPAEVNRRVLRMFAVGACGAAALNLARLAAGALRSETPLTAALHLARTVRVSLPYPDVNAGGSYFLLALLIACGIFAAAGSRARAGWGAALVLLGAALWISGSRAALIVALVAAVVLTALWTTRSRRLWMLGAVAMLAALLVVVFPYPIVDRTMVDAVSIRAEMTRAAVRMFATRPVFGVGVGQFFERSAEFIRDPAVQAHYVRENAHNNFLQILAETGILGLAAFLWLLVATGQAAIRGLRGAERSGPLAGAVVGLGAFLTTCLAGHPLLITEVAIAFWGVLGATVAAAPPAATPLRPAAGRLAAAAMITLAVTLPVRIGLETNAVELDHVGYRVTGWHFDRDGIRYRQMTSGATLFIPAAAAVIELPYRLQWGRDPVTLRLDFRGRTADRLVVSDHDWRTYRLVVPEAGPNARRYVPLELTVLQGDESAVLLGKMVVHQRKGAQ